MCFTYQQDLSSKVGAVLVAVGARDDKETKAALKDLKQTLRGEANRAEASDLINRIQSSRSIEDTNTLEADIVNFCAIVATDYYERSSPMSGGYKSEWHQVGYGVPTAKRFREIPVPSAEVVEREPVFVGIDDSVEPARVDFVTV